MSKEYYMTLPNWEKDTCIKAVEWIKENFPHINDGFAIQYKDPDIKSLEECYKYRSFSWRDKDPFLFWGGAKADRMIEVPFPEDRDSIPIGEL